MFDVLDMPLNWPVEVNYHEAHAFCSWRGQGYRLLTEAEMNVIREDKLPPSAGTKCDVIYQDDAKFNLNLRYGSSTVSEDFTLFHCHNTTITTVELCFLVLAYYTVKLHSVKLR